MSRLLAAAPITAIVYHEGRDVDPVMHRLIDRLAEQSLSLAGFIQRDTWRPDRPRCDMILEDLSGGQAIKISEDRGAGARGCRLDPSELLRAMAAAREAIATRPDLLIVNKFGKTESEGGGFRDLIAEAVAQNVPTLVAVPWRNIDNWRRFAGDFAVEYRVEDLPSDEAGLCRVLGFQLRETADERTAPSPEM